MKCSIHSMQSSLTIRRLQNAMRKAYIAIFSTAFVIYILTKYTISTTIRTINTLSRALLMMRLIESQEELQQEKCNTSAILTL